MSYLVLVVEEEPFIREALVDIFDILGLEVITARNGSEAINIFQSHYEDISLVLIDLRLKGFFSGFEVFNVLQTIDPNVKMIVSSAYHDDMLGRMLKSYSTVTILNKPYNTKALVGVVREALGNHIVTTPFLPPYASGQEHRL